MLAVLERLMMTRGRVTDPTVWRASQQPMHSDKVKSDIVNDIYPVYTQVITAHCRH
jgi:hypothetical protein